MRTWVAALHLVSVFAVTPARGQGPGPDTATLPWSALALLPQLRLDEISYPALMRRAALSGTVQLEMIVGPQGVPEWDRTRVIFSSDALFTRSVRWAAARWRFAIPPLSDGGAAIRVPVEVVFAAPPAHDAPIRELSRITRLDSAGIQVLVGWEDLPRTATAPADTADVKWAKLAVLFRLLAEAVPESDARTCARWGERPATLPAAMIRRVRMQYPDVMNSDLCPRPARPSSSAHTRWVAIASIDPWTPDLYVVRAVVASVSVRSTYYCEAGRDERGRWLATCELRESDTSD